MFISYICTYIYICACIYTYTFRMKAMHVYVCICLYIYIYIYIYSVQMRAMWYGLCCAYTCTTRTHACTTRTQACTHAHADIHIPLGKAAQHSVALHTCKSEVKTLSNPHPKFAWTCMHTYIRNIHKHAHRATYWSHSHNKTSQNQPKGTSTHKKQANSLDILMTLPNTIIHTRNRSTCRRICSPQRTNHRQACTRLSRRRLICRFLQSYATSSTSASEHLVACVFACVVKWSYFVSKI